MKILYAIHQYFPDNRGGSEQVLARLSKQIEALGHEAVVCAFSHDRELPYTHEESGFRFRKTEYDGIPLIEFSPVEKEWPAGSVWGELECGALARRILREEKPDVVHLVHTIHVGAFADVAYELGIPYVCTVTDFWPVCRRVNLMRPHGPCPSSEKGEACAGACGFTDGQSGAQQRRQAQRLSRAAAVAVPSEFVAKRLSEELGIEPAKVIPHGVDREGLARKTYRPKRCGDPIEFSVCAFQTPAKGLDIALGAMALLQARPDVRLNVYGGLVGEYGRTMRALAASDARIRFWGPYTRAQERAIFEATDVLLVPSTCPETYQLVMREAAICGVPCIATRIGAMRDFIEDGKNGLTFGLNNELDLAVKMYDLITHPDKIEVFGRAAAETQIPTVEQEAKMYQEIYHSAR